jgi:uncharacterized SAM-dependent methyltransferase
LQADDEGNVVGINVIKIAMWLSTAPRRLMVFEEEDTLCQFSEAFIMLSSMLTSTLIALIYAYFDANINNVCIDMSSRLAQLETYVAKISQVTV